MNDVSQINAEGSETAARDEVRLRVLRALEVNPELSQRQLAVELGVSLGGVNFALKALMARGFVKVENFRKSDRKVGLLVCFDASGDRGKDVPRGCVLGQKA
jgi:DNA-binding Lrp family transcriptional regulator